MPPVTRNGVLCGFLLAAAYWMMGPIAAGTLVALAAGVFVALGDMMGGWRAGLISGLTASAIMTGTIGLNMGVLW